MDYQTEYREKRGPYKKRVYEQYLKFSAMARYERIEIYGFGDNEGFAKKYKVNPCTLVRWNQDEDFSKRLGDLIEESFEARHPYNPEKFIL